MHAGKLTALLVAGLSLTGCHLIGPLRDHNPENKVNSPSNPAYQPPADEKPIIVPRTNQPRQPGQSIH
jgi:predicted small lipoprotein YifL